MTRYALPPSSQCKLGFFKISKMGLSQNVEILCSLSTEFHEEFNDKQLNSVRGTKGENTFTFIPQIESKPDSNQNRLPGFPSHCT